jgi:hypothetical protein
MRPATTIRKWHVDQLRCSLTTAQYILQTASNKDLTTYRDQDEGWTAAEVMGHLLDCERLFLERAQLTMTYDCPDLPFPDQVEDVIKGHYNDRDPQSILADWQQARSDHLTYLAAIPDEAWTREGKHPRYGLFSLTDLLFLACWHDMLHIEQITRILTAKKSD